MYRHVPLPTDGSELSERAARDGVRTHDADTCSLATIQHERDDLAAVARLSTRPSVDAHHVAREKRAQAWVILGQKRRSSMKAIGG